MLGRQTVISFELFTAFGEYLTVIYKLRPLNGDSRLLLFNSDYNLASRYSRKVIGKRAYVENITDDQTWNSRDASVYSRVNLKRKVRQHVKVTVCALRCLASKPCSTSDLNCRYLNPYIKLNFIELAITLYTCHI